MNDLCTSCSLGTQTTALDRQEFGAQVVSKTMDKMNKMPNEAGTDQELGGYQFQQDVLGAYAGIGATINVTV